MIGRVHPPAASPPSGATPRVVTRVAELINFVRGTTASGILYEGSRLAPETQTGLLEALLQKSPEVLLAGINPSIADSFPRADNPLQTLRNMITYLADPAKVKTAKPLIEMLQNLDFLHRSQFVSIPVPENGGTPPPPEERHPIRSITELIQWLDEGFRFNDCFRLDVQTQNELATFFTGMDPNALMLGTSLSDNFPRDRSPRTMTRNLVAFAANTSGPASKADLVKVLRNAISKNGLMPLPRITLPTLAAESPQPTAAKPPAAPPPPPVARHHPVFTSRVQATIGTEQAVLPADGSHVGVLSGALQLYVSDGSVWGIPHPGVIGHLTVDKIALREGEPVRLDDGVFLGLGASQIRLSLEAIEDPTSDGTQKNPLVLAQKTSIGPKKQDPDVGYTGRANFEDLIDFLLEGKTLPHEFILKLTAIIINWRIDYPKCRNALLAGIPPSFTSSLRECDTPFDQISADLSLMNGCRLANRQVPMVTMLLNARAIWRAMNIDRSHLFGNVNPEETAHSMGFESFDALMASLREGKKLSHENLLRIYEAIIDWGIDYSSKKEAMGEKIHPRVLAMLPQLPFGFAQLLSDLNYLNSTGLLSDQSSPLAQMLMNARKLQSEKKT